MGKALPRKKSLGPTLRAQWLGKQLKLLREGSGKTLNDAGDFLQRNIGTISRFESAEYPIRRPDVMALLDLYGVTDKPRRDAMLEMSEDVWQTGWWENYTDVLSPEFVDFAWVEARATKISTYDAIVPPGAMQTKEFAEELMRQVDGEHATALTTRGLELRMARQEMLDGDEPTPFETILDEAVLRRVVGSPELTRNQLKHLAALARRPHIEIRVLPLRESVHIGVDGAFFLFEMPEPYSDVAYVDGMAGRFYMEESADVERFLRAYDRLWQATLGPRKSVELILAAAKELE